MILDREDFEEIQIYLNKYYENHIKDEELERLIVKMDDQPCFTKFQWQEMLRIVVGYWEDLKEYQKNEKKFELSQFRVKEMEDMIEKLEYITESKWY